MNFIFWFFLIGFLIAALQDLDRREVDNWLNLFLFFSGFLYVLFNVFYYKELSFLINFSFMVFLMFGLAHLFYFLKIFSGGDCKLLFASTPLLVSFDFFSSLNNILFFLVTLLFIGALYGTLWIIWLVIRDFRKNKKDLIESIRKNYFYGLFVILFALLSFKDPIFLFLALYSIFLMAVFLVSQAVEKNSLIRIIDSKEVREGDWLESDISIKGKTIKYSFEGLSSRDVSLLKKYKIKVKIKEGIPYAPVFFFSWIFFSFRGIFMEAVVSILGG